ncbi:MAG: metal-sensing transcriptional repressor [bacterium]|nr:metal-sensing transcriptional repressor [bacterium]
MKTDTVRRLNIIEGQVRGLREMIEKDAYCIDVITQSSAVKQGLSNVEDLILQDHLSTCLVKQIKNGSAKKAVGEIINVYKLKRK